MLEIRIERGPTAVLPALEDDSLVFLPLRQLLELAEARVMVFAPDSLLAGRLEPPARPFAFDTRRGRLALGDTVLPLADDAARWRDGDLFVRSDLISRVLDVSFRMSWDDLIVAVGGTGRLPVVRRQERERRRAELLAGAPLPVAELRVEPPRRLADGAVLDWSYTGSTADPLGTSTLQLGLGTQVVGGALELRQLRRQASGDASSQTRWSWTRAWTGSRWLRQARLGDLVSTTRRGRSFRGAELSNAPFLRDAEFGLDQFRGTVGAGWLVDLYQSDRLLAFSSTDSAGRFVAGVPVQYGPNPVELIAYGPNGEVRRRRGTFLVPLDRLPRGRFEYTAGGGECRDLRCRATAGASARYGLSNRVTVEGGTEYFWRDTLPSLAHPYALVSAAATTSLGLTAEVVGKGLARGRVDYDPTPDLHLDVGHTVYSAADPAPLVGSRLERHRTEAVLFWRPAPERASTYLQAAASRVATADGIRTRGRLAATTVRGSTRLLVGLQHERRRQGAIVERTAGVEAATDAQVTGRSFARGALLRAALLLTRGHGLASLGLGAGRQLAGAVRADLEALWRRDRRGTALNLTLSTALPSLRAVSRNQYDPAAGIQGTQTVEGSLVWDRRQHAVRMEGGRSLGRAGVAGSVFLDANANGRRDPGESGVERVRLRVASRGVVTDSVGRYVTWDLVPFEPTTIWVDTLSVSDPTWVPAAVQTTFVPGPNTSEAVDIALVPAGELGARAIWSTSAQGVPGVTVRLRHRETGAVSQSTTFGDGSLELVGLRPGVYEATLAPETARALGVSIAPVELTVRAGAREPGAAEIVIPIPAPRNGK